VQDASVALQHNLGLGGAVVITVYKKPDGSKNSILSDEQIKKFSWFEYNPAVKARYVTMAEADKVRSKKNRNDYALGDTPEKLSARL